MASLARAAGAAAAAVRSAARSAPLTGCALVAPLPSLASPSAAARRSARILRRSAAAASAGLETLMPLHSAVAAARLRSCIAVDSSCWSSLSQGKPCSSCYHCVGDNTMLSSLLGSAVDCCILYNNFVCFFFSRTISCACAATISCDCAFSGFGSVEGGKKAQASFDS
ncbi:hypothetical protein PVAP13_5KG304914 [Panicum virgatum]|uniref:Uncharacterized protein n=1 Tax=Panicum virgatum TaxID=38727 RepID=A0A8T0SGT8_PANVG|nr:hypothetical protein PVAP13_5KG304914 [Panicum virgatum]